MFTDGEAMLMMLNGQDRNNHARSIRAANAEIQKGNAEIRRLRAMLAQAQIDLTDERARRQVAESKLRRH